MCRQGSQSCSGIVGRCGRRETGGFQSSSLDSLRMSIGRSTSSTGSFECTWDIQRGASSTGRAGFVALSRSSQLKYIMARGGFFFYAPHLDFANTARITSFAQPVSLLILPSTAHHAEPLIYQAIPVGLRRRGRIVLLLRGLALVMRVELGVLLLLILRRQTMGGTVQAVDVAIAVAAHGTLHVRMGVLVGDLGIIDRHFALESTGLERIGLEIGSIGGFFWQCGAIAAAAVRVG